MRIEITIGGQRFRAALTESAAARDLMAQLPITIDMVDHGGVEKTGPLPFPLSLEGQPEGADPDVGDVGYYAPGQDLVFYYGDQSYFPGIVVLGTWRVTPPSTSPNWPAPSRRPSKRGDHDGDEGLPRARQSGRDHRGRQRRTTVFTPLHARHARTWRATMAA